MIKVLLFAGLAEAAGCLEVQFDVESTTVSELKKMMIERFPDMKDKILMSFVAVNQEYVSVETAVIGPKDETAFIPPVSGG